MNGEIHAPGEARKVHTSSLGAFVSLENGPLGSLDASGIKWLRSAGETPSIPPNSIGPAVSVAYYAAVIDDSLTVLETIADGDFEGLVVAAFGGGHMAEKTADLLGRMACAMPVVLASRTGSGKVLEDVYAYKGGEIDLIGRGLIPAGRLDARKSRILLTLALSAGWSVAEIRTAFNKF